MKQFLMFAVMIFALAGPGYAQEAAKPAPQPVQKVDKTAPEVKTIPQPKEWSDKYAQYVALMKQIQKIYEDTGLNQLEKLATNLQADLRSSVPAGYQPDGNGNFVKIEAPATPEKK